jgi:hypothetical protein
MPTERREGLDDRDLAILRALDTFTEPQTAKVIWEAVNWGEYADVQLKDPGRAGVAWLLVRMSRPRLGYVKRVGPGVNRYTRTAKALESSL